MPTLITSLKLNYFFKECISKFSRILRYEFTGEWEWRAKHDTISSIAVRNTNLLFGTECVQPVSMAQTLKYPSSCVSLSNPVATRMFHALISMSGGPIIHGQIIGIHGILHKFQSTLG